ncbi:hypothetical protein SKAU_G00275610 [Synaphobranchus kaupii]|uniref:PiggyBac transposable element-derived protein domain-containing protein n=1 Tax=Synaphobranchus kaupii TaxID=118154 RepID=A0A9Q1F166_SYNKA|nr:hypothetical protein SKAU_G00275610 [Synaphobranchus kaupii]
MLVSSPVRSRSPSPLPSVSQGLPPCQPCPAGFPLKKPRRQAAGQRSVPQCSSARGAARRGRGRTRVQRQADRCPSSSLSRSHSPPPPLPVQGERWMDGSEQDEQPSVHPFAPARTPGAQLDFTKEYSPLELFQLTFSQSVVQTLCTNTNKKAQRRIDQGMKTPWSPLEPGELYRYFGVLISMGLVRCPETRDYWSRARCYSLPFPRTVFSRTRFEAISWAVHISDPDTDGQNDALRGTDRYDRLFRLCPLIDEVVAACRSFYQPRQQLSIDERMVATKARIGFKQYMKAKPTKWGFKLFVLSDACNGYTCDFNVYTGKQKSPTGKGLSHDAVINLLTPYLGTGYQVYVDNWYTSTALFQELHVMRFGACGTCRENRKGYPVTKVNDMPRKAERGTVKWIRQGQMLYVKWMDTREVKMCSTLHMAFQGDTTVRNVRNTDGTWTSCRVPIPVSVREYNKFMGGVDLSDALLKYYSIRRKTMKWYKALLFHFIDVQLSTASCCIRILQHRSSAGPSHTSASGNCLLLVVVLWVQLVDLVASQSLSVTLAQWIAPTRRQQAGGDVFIAVLMVVCGVKLPSSHHPMSDPLPTTHASTHTTLGLSLSSSPHSQPYDPGYPKETIWGIVHDPSGGRSEVSL